MSTTPQVNHLIE